MHEQFKLDLNAITLGQMMDVEIASGRAFMDLVRSRTGLLMIALYLRALQQREPGTPLPSWKELEGMAPSAALHYAQRSPQDSDSTT